MSGAKNAVLPILAATLLTSEPCVIHRVPDLSDVRFMSQILTWLGAEVKSEPGTIRVRAKKIKGTGDYDLVRKMRGSICIMVRYWAGCMRRVFRCRVDASLERGRSISI